MKPALTVVTDDWRGELVAQMMAAGIEAPPEEIIADGEIHRFAPTPGRHDATGWYVVLPDAGGPVWRFGDWRTDIKERGEHCGRVLDRKELAARRKRLETLQRKIAAEDDRFHAGAAIEARQRWDRSPPAPANHEYLRHKQIDPCGLRVDGANLLVPMRDIEGKLWSLQEIAPDGHKLNQTGGLRRGCFSLIGEAGGTLCIAEGFSTAASIHMATDYAVAAAGEAGNLERVAMALRGKYPTAAIVVCADDDWMTRVNGKSKNVGKLAGEKAAQAIGAALAVPWFGPARPRWATDFNDQAKLSGLHDVADAIRLALVAHKETIERQQAEEPPPSTPEDYGRSSADDSAMLSEDALALHFAETNDGLRFVAPWSRWFEWAASRWRPDEKLHTMSLARETCRQAAGGVE
jgi:putative DNA primase/helicase